MGLRMLIVLFGLFVFLGCSKPDKTQVKDDFYANYENTTILSLLMGEGDSDNVYYHIKYKDNKSEKIKEVEFLYQKVNDEWKLKI